MKIKQSGGIFQRPPKSGVFWIDYYDAGRKRHREKIGRRSEALEAFARRQAEIREGRYLSPRSAAVSFRDLAIAGMQHKKLRLAPQSYKTDCLRLETILPMIGATPAELLTPEQLEKLFSDLRAAGNSGSTVNRYRSLISSIYSFALRTGRLRTNPVARVKRFRENDSRVRYLKDDEETRLRGVVRETCPDHEPELDLALYTGMRRGEQFTLKWKDVDLDRGILTVKGKTGRRFIVVNSSTRAAIERLQLAKKADAVYVCRSTKDDAQRDWRRWLEDSAKAAGVQDFHWHDLRHTFASRLVMAGVDIRTVQELLGHKSILMTMRYAHLSPDHRQAAVEKIGSKS
jgi:site-specific recombinase XerD